MRKRSTLLAGLMAACVLLAPGLSTASDSKWPDKPVRLIVVQAPGSGSDILGRIVADKLGEKIKGSVVVENKPGAAGIIGHQHVLSSPRDGYTFLISSTANLLVVPRMTNRAGFTASDFVPVIPLMQTPYVVLVATSEGKPKSFQELLQALRAQAVTFASVGAGSIGHLAAEVIAERAESTHKPIHIPYRGSNQALTDVAGGQALFAVDSVSAALPLIRAGKLRPLAVTSKERLQSLPGVPTVAEAGLPAFDMTTTAGVFAATGVPPAILEQMQAAGKALLQDPAVLKRFAEQESSALEISPQAYGDFLAKESPFYEALVKRLNIRME